jgi:hypothetical protein
MPQRHQLWGLERNMQGWGLIHLPQVPDYSLGSHDGVETETGIRVPPGGVTRLVRPQLAHPKNENLPERL